MSALRIVRLPPGANVLAYCTRPPRVMMSRRCGLLPNYFFGHLFSLVSLVAWGSWCSEAVVHCIACSPYSFATGHRGEKAAGLQR